MKATLIAVNGKPYKPAQSEMILNHKPYNSKVNMQAQAVHEELQDIIPDTTPKPLAGGLSKSEYRALVVAEFNQAKHEPHDTKVRYAYECFANETLQQFKVLLARGFQYRFTFTDPVDPKTGTPSYKYTKAQFEATGILPIFRTQLYEHDILASDAIFDEEIFNPHDLDTDNILFDVNDKEWFLTYNDIFRAVHDTLGHLASGGTFSESGEQTAYRSHSRLYSPIARMALFTETVGQNSYYNTYKKFAPQKCTVIDSKFYGLY